MSEAAPLDAAAIQAICDGSPFVRSLGLAVVEADAEALEILFRMEMQPHLERLAGSNQFHGGPLAALIDVAGDFAVALAVGGGVPTIDLRVDYLRPAFGPHVDARARARRVGRTVGIADVDIVGADGKLCAIGRGCYSAKVG